MNRSILETGGKQAPKRIDSLSFSRNNGLKKFILATSDIEILIRKQTLLTIFKRISQCFKYLKRSEKKLLLGTLIQNNFDYSHPIPENCADLNEK